MDAVVRRVIENAMRVSSLASLGPGALAAIREGLGDPSLSIRLLAGIDVDSAAPSTRCGGCRVLPPPRESLNAAFAAGLDEVLDRLRARIRPPSGRSSRVEQFSSTFGSRGQNEYDLIAVSWEVRPRIVVAAIDLMRRSDEARPRSARHAVFVAERDRFVADVRAARRRR